MGVKTMQCVIVFSLAILLSIKAVQAQGFSKADCEIRVNGVDLIVGSCKIEVGEYDFVRIESDKISETGRPVGVVELAYDAGEIFAVNYASYSMSRMATLAVDSLSGSLLANGGCISSKEISLCVSELESAILPASQASEGPIDLEKWCLPADECSGQIRINADGFDMCEESCRVENEVQVDGMRSILFDLSCSSDYAGNTVKRTFFSEYTDGISGEHSAIIVNESGATQLIECESGDNL